MKIFKQTNKPYNPYNFEAKGDFSQISIREIISTNYNHVCENILIKKWACPEELWACPEELATRGV